VILADEPTTALDVTIQAQVLDVLRLAQRETGAALVFVSHDLGVIAGFADRVAVMYAGRIVETAPVEELFARPTDAVHVGLIGAVPRLDAATGRQPLVPIPRCATADDQPARRLPVRAALPARRGCVPGFRTGPGRRW